MEYKEILIIAVILLICFLGRNANGNTSEEEQKIATVVGASIVYPLLGIGALAIILGVLSSPFFWAFFIPYLIVKFTEK